MIRIRQTDINDAVFKSLSARFGSIFIQPNWIKLYGASIRVMGLYNLNEELTGAFTVFIASKAGQSYMIVPPFSPHNGLFYLNPSQAQSAKLSYDKEVHRQIALWMDKEKGFLKVTAFPPEHLDMQEYFWKKFKVVPNYTYRLSLENSEEDLFSNLSGEKRKSIRKANKDGLTTSIVHTYDEAIKLIAGTFDRRKKKTDLPFIRKILNEFASPENSFAVVTEFHGKPSACTCVVYYNEVAYYLFGGYDTLNKHHGAGPAAMWEAILEARRLGLKTFDFEGSMIPEVEKYFRDFGGKQVPYFTLQKAWLPVEMLLKLKMRSRF